MLKKILCAIIKKKLTDKVVEKVITNKKTLLDVSLRDIGKGAKKTIKKGLLKIVSKI